MDVIDKQLLELLACPETHQPLSVAEGTVIQSINERIAAGGVQNVGGEAVSVPLEAGLAREDGKIVYPIRDTIPVLLASEGIPAKG